MKIGETKIVILINYKDFRLYSWCLIATGVFPRVLYYNQDTRNSNFFFFLQCVHLIKIIKLIIFA